MAVLLLALAAVAPVRADEVGAWLERHGMDQLLAVYLEQQLKGLAGEERQAHVLQLVGIYARLLEATDDPDLLKDLEDRSRKLLASAAESAGEELRLALLSGSYRGAERVAERHRLRLASDEEIERAKETLSDIIPKLARLEGQIETRMQVTERRLMRASGTDAAVLSERAEEIGRLHARAMFLRAWALYYQSWINQRADNARVAEEVFAKLLAAESPRPDPEEISEDLRGIEAMARSILGTALCRSLTASSGVATQWLDLLTHPNTWEPLREQLPVWRLVVALEHGEFRAARTMLGAIGDDGGKVPVAWIRLAAVYALESDDPDAVDLAQLAVARLAARGELKVVLELADRYGIDALGQTGFAFRYVRGVRHYDRARDAHGGDEPVADPEIGRIYQAAAGEFAAALGEADADRYPEAAASCRWLMGWCRFFQGHFLEARNAFEEAARKLGPAQAPEALWMAVVCLDRALQDGADPALEREMAALIDDVLARYPRSPYTARLRFRRATQREASPDVVAELLAIPPDSEVYHAARRRAARMLYELFRGAQGQQRLDYGNDYLAVALPLLASAERALDERDARALAAHVARSRRVLEVALASGILRVTAAERVLDALDALASRGANLSKHRDELDCRHVQERLLNGDVASAEVFADQIWARRPDSVWAQLAERTLFRYGLERWRADGADDTTAMQLIVRHGRRVVREYDDDPTALNDPRVLAYHAAVAEALMLDAEQRRDDAQKAEALALYERLLAASPNDARFLRATAILAEDRGRLDLSLQCWRTLVSGLTVGTDRWFEARFHVILLLAETDPARARAIMEQHKQLNSGYGPEPWASRLRHLDERLQGRSGEQTP